MGRYRWFFLLGAWAVGCAVDVPEVGSVTEAASATPAVVCGNARAPVCNGTCPEGQECGSTGTECVCGLACARADVEFDECYLGVCPYGQQCAARGVRCQCVYTCKNTARPGQAVMCNGTCPPGEVCAPEADGCACR